MEYHIWAAKFPRPGVAHWTGVLDEGQSCVWAAASGLVYLAVFERPITPSAGELGLALYSFFAMRPAE